MDSLVSPQDLRDVPLLAGLDDLGLTEFISHCETVICPPQTIILSQGSQDRALMIVLDGDVQVRLSVPHVGDELVMELPAGSVFGEVSFFHAAPHSATVQCVKPARLLRLQRSKFDKLKAADNWMALVLAANAAELLAQRLQQVDRWIGQRLTEIQDQRIHQSWRVFRERLGHPTHVSGGFKV
jgi:CRP-like cAMP-binding protein